MLYDEKDTVITSKSQSKLRWLILFLCCVMMIGNYYTYDIPAALKSQLDDYMGNPDNYETLFSLLYTLYSIPNIFIPLFGGYIIDKFGHRICMILFATLITIGQVVFTIGVSAKSWEVMFVGRIIYGFGGESLGVANSSILADWFLGKEVAFAFGLNLSIARLGSVINNIVSPTLESSISLQFAMWFGVFLTGGSLLSTIIIFGIDKKMDSVIQENINNPALLRESLNTPILENEKFEDESKRESVVKISDVLKMKFAFWVLVASCVIVYGCVLPFNNIASSLLLERDYFKEPSSSCMLYDPYNCQSDDNQPQNCPSSEWYQPPLPVNFTSEDVDCEDSFWSDGCTVEYCDRKDKAQIQATTIMSIPYIISACLSPFLGKFVDRFGLRAVIACIAPGILILVHLLLGLSDVDPIGPLVGQGLAYASFAAVIWPSIPLVVEAQLTGLGYGVCTCIQNAGLAIFPVIIATIYESSDNYYIPNVEFFFVSLACLGFLIGIYLNIYDYNHGSIFNSPKSEAEEGISAKLSIGSFTIAEETMRANKSK